MSDTRVVCLNCMDGRIQLPVLHWIKEHFSIDYVDVITEPGMDGILSDKTCDVPSVERKINISIEKNGATKIFVAGHHDCRGNPVSDEEHQRQIRVSVEWLQKDYADMEVVALWVNDQWRVERLEL